MEHYQRWKQNCGILRIDVPLTPEELCAITAELARRNTFHTDLYIRPLAYKCAERIGVAIDDQDAFSIVALPFGEYLHSENGLHAGVSSWRRIEDNAIPPRAKICGAYANSALASDEARRCGIRRGHPAERERPRDRGRHLQPLHAAQRPADHAGRHRERAGRHHARLHHGACRSASWASEIVERPIDRSELYVCDELFLTGTAVGVAPVVRVDHRPVADGAIGAVTRSLRQLYFDATHGHLPAYRKWLLPVYGSGRPPEQNAARAEETSLA